MASRAIPQVTGDQGDRGTYNLEEEILVGMVEIPRAEILPAGEVVLTILKIVMICQAAVQELVIHQEDVCVEETKNKEIKKIFRTSP